MTNCRPAENDQSNRDAPELYLMWGLEGLGFLIVPIQHGAIVIRLKPAYLRLVYLLWLAQQEDRDEIVEIRGWRHRDQLAEGMGDLLPNVLPIEPSTIVHYVHYINKLMNKEYATRQCLDELFVLIQRAQGKGYRLALEGLVIVDRAKRLLKEN